MAIPPSDYRKRLRVPPYKGFDIEMFVAIAFDRHAFLAKSCQWLFLCNNAEDHTDLCHDFFYMTG